MMVARSVGRSTHACFYSFCRVFAYKARMGWRGVCVCCWAVDNLIAVGGRSEAARVCAPQKCLGCVRNTSVRNTKALSMQSVCEGINLASTRLVLVWQQYCVVGERTRFF